MKTISRQYDETNEAGVRELAKQLGFQDDGTTPLPDIELSIESLTFEKFDKAVYNVALPVELAKAQPTLDAAKAATAAADAAAKAVVEQSKPK
jgi:hypothetical protein